MSLQDSKVMVIRLNGNSTEMQIANTPRVFKRDINLNFEPSGMIIRQIHSNAEADLTAGISVYSTLSNEEIAIIGGAQISSPLTFIKFTNGFKNGYYDFVLMQTYTSEENIKPIIHKSFAGEIILVVEFVKFK